MGSTKHKTTYEVASCIFLLRVDSTSFLGVMLCKTQLLRRCTGTPSVLAGIKACKYNSGMISVVTPVSFSVICCASWSRVTLLSTPLQWERLALLSLRVQYAMETRSPNKAQSHLCEWLLSSPVYASESSTGVNNQDAVPFNATVPPKLWRDCMPG